MTTPYVDVEDGDTYAADKLHTGGWDEADDNTKEKALKEATRMVDRLNFAGFKHSAWLVAEAGGTDENIVAADATQERQFPRGSDTAVPQDVLDACCEIALYLLENDYDADLEQMHLGIQSQGISSARITYDAAKAREHLGAGIPSITAWRLLRPYIGTNNSIKVSRV